MHISKKLYRPNSGTVILQTTTFQFVFHAQGHILQLVCDCIRKVGKMGVTGYNIKRRFLLISWHFTKTMPCIASRCWADRYLYVYWSFFTDNSCLLLLKTSGDGCSCISTCDTFHFIYTHLTNSLKNYFDIKMHFDLYFIM